MPVTPCNLCRDPAFVSFIRGTIPTPQKKERLCFSSSDPDAPRYAVRRVPTSHIAFLRAHAQEAHPPLTHTLLRL